MRFTAMPLLLSRSSNTITSRIRSGEGSLGKFLNDPALANSLTATAQNIEGVTGKLNQRRGTAGKLLNETVLYDRLNSTIQQLESFSKTLNTGRRHRRTAAQRQAVV